MLQGKGLKRHLGTEGPAWGKAQERGVSAEPPGCEQINGAEQRQSFVLLPCPCHGAGGGGAITLGATQAACSPPGTSEQGDCLNPLLGSAASSGQLLLEGLGVGRQLGARSPVCAPQPVRGHLWKARGDRSPQPLCSSCT